MRCDLCSKGSEAGPVLVESPTPPAFERRSKPRKHHQACVDALRAHQAAEKERVDQWVDRQFEEFTTRRLAGVS